MSYLSKLQHMPEMKRLLFCLWLGALALAPSYAQAPPDTVRATLVSVNNPEKLIFTLEDGDGTLKVHLGGKPKTIAPGFYALDVRPGDTLTVAGVRKPRKRGKKGDESEMVSAAVLGIDYAFDHDERSGYYFSLDQKPSFQGAGLNGFTKWVNARLVYPQSSRDLGSEGQVRLQFTIEKNGELDNVSVVKSSGDPLLDAEAFRVVSSSPAWTPGAFHGKPVKVTFTFPVIFRLKEPLSKVKTGPSGWSTRK